LGSDATNSGKITGLPILQPLHRNIQYSPEGVRQQLAKAASKQDSNNFSPSRTEFFLYKGKVIPVTGHEGP
jgi:hypothetical protein